MTWKTTATLIALSPFALLWLGFAAAETARAVAAIKGGRRHGR
ncbi:MAG: hypothetical protein ACR652_05335 [Methylocystis sp.]